MSKTSNAINPIVFILGSIILSIIGILSFIFKCSLWLPLCAILTIDLYLILLLLFAARISDGNHRYVTGVKPHPLPTRFVGFIMFFLFFVSFIFCFANIYLGMGQEFTNQIKHPIDALYFSLVTIATVGYGDYAPASGMSKLFVMLEIVSGIILFLGALPLLVSQSASYELDNF